MGKAKEKGKRVEKRKRAAEGVGERDDKQLRRLSSNGENGD